MTRMVESRSDDSEKCHNASSSIAMVVHLGIHFGFGVRIGVAFSPISLSQGRVDHREQQG